MKRIFSVLLISLPAFMLIFCTASTSGNESKLSVNKTNVKTKNSIAVLELFTSQGCSSCPPADRLLGKYAAMNNLIALSFHVDYWNRLGWKDPFSNAAFSQRQNKYAGVLKSSSVYTPQLIINGEKEIVGSDESNITAAIKRFENQESNVVLNIKKVVTDDNKVTVDFAIQGAVNNSLLNIALVQNKITTEIKAGENTGVKLTNYNVVRNFKTISLVAEGTHSISVDLLPGIDKKDLSVVLYVQDAATYKISNAAESSL